MNQYTKKAMDQTMVHPAQKLAAVSTSVMQTGVISISKPQPKASTTYAVTINFSNKEDATEFVEDLEMLQDPEMKASFIQADKESKLNLARPMRELYKKYGV